jgi:hypothetical protein
VDFYSGLKKGLVGEKPFPDNIREDYRRTFDTDVGRRVLTHILTELHFFDEVISEEEVTLNNYARRILHHLGILRSDLILDVTQALMTIDVYKEDKK